MKIQDCASNQRPNLHHVHDGSELGTTHTHDTVDHYGRDFEDIPHSHDVDGNITVEGSRHKVPKHTFG